MHARLRGSKKLINYTKLEIKPDLPSLADEIAEPHPDMNIKVAAFTVSEKLGNTALESYNGLRITLPRWRIKCLQNNNNGGYMYH